MCPEYINNSYKSLKENISGNPIRGQKTWNRHFSKKDIQKYVQYLSSLVTWQMQIKTALGNHVRTVNIEKLDKSNTGNEKEIAGNLTH